MRICFFNRSYWPDQAATGEFLTELAQDLVSRHGCSVTVVAGRALHGSTGEEGGRRLVAAEVRQGVTILRASGSRRSTTSFTGRAANYLSYFASATAASFQIGRPDIVVSLTDPPIIGVTALATARRVGARFVFLCEDVFPDVAALLEDFHSDAVNWALERTNRYLLRHADAVVAVGDRMRQRLVDEKGADPARMHVIHNWADNEAIVPRAKDNPFARAHGLSDRFVLMHSGNVGFSQNLDVLVEAADRLRSKERLMVVIVGHGAKREALERMAVERQLTNLQFLPYQPKAALADAFGAADAFLVSLKQGIEGYIVPSKVYGILAAGRPYIAATDASCEAAVIARDAGCGIVAVPGDPNALASAILALYENPDRTREMGMKARRAAARFDRRVAVQAYYDLFARLAGVARAA